MTRGSLCLGFFLGLAPLASGLARSPAKIPIDAALEEVVQGRRDLEQLEIRLAWRRNGTLESSELFGRGVGIWKEQIQFPFSRARAMRLIRAILSSRFGDLKDRYGVAPEFDEPLRMKGRVDVRIGPVSKKVLQLGEGEQSRPLQRLADRILRDSEGWARVGVGASSLQDALEKLAAGRLAPETVRVTVQERTGSRQAGGHGGWLLHLNGRTAVGRAFRTSDGFADPVRLTLSRSEFAGAIEILRKANLESLPRNLYAAEYADLSVEVLNQVRSLEGRRYAGQTRQTHGPQQIVFESVLRELRSLHERVIREGERFSELESSGRSSFDPARSSLSSARELVTEGDSIGTGRDAGAATSSLGELEEWR